LIVRSGDPERAKREEMHQKTRQRLFLFPMLFFRPTTTMTISSTAVVFRFPNHLEAPATPLFARSLFPSHANQFDFLFPA